MDLFEELRREYEFGLASISGVARKFGVHRRMVREAIESSIPMRLPAKARPRPTIGPVADVHRRDSGSGSAGAAQAAPYGASHLGADWQRAVGLPDRRVDGASVCAGAKTDAWAARGA